MNAMHSSSTDHFTQYSHHKTTSFSTLLALASKLLLLFLLQFTDCHTHFCLHLETTLFITAFPHSTNVSKPCPVFDFSGLEFCPSPGHYQQHCPRGYLEFVGAKSGRQKPHKLLHAICFPLFHIYFISPHSF